LGHPKIPRSSQGCQGTLTIWYWGGGGGGAYGTLWAPPHAPVEGPMGPSLFLDSWKNCPDMSDRCIIISKDTRTRNTNQQLHLLMMEGILQLSADSVAQKINMFATIGLDPVKLVPSTRHRVPRTKYQVPRTKYQVPSPHR